MPPGKQSAAEGKRCQVSISYSIKTNSTGSPRAIADGMRRFSTQYGIEVTGAQRDIFGVVAVAVEEGVRSEIGIIENLPQVDVSQIEASQAVTIS